MNTSNVATKADVKAVKADVLKVKTELKANILEVRTELKEDILKVKIELKEDIKELRTDYQKLDVKLDRLQNTLDGFVGTVDDLRTDNTVGTHHTRELQITVDDHEKRLKQIESSKQAV